MKTSRVSVSENPVAKLPVSVGLGVALPVYLFFCAGSGLAQISPHNSIANGDWSSPLTWSSGAVPGLNVGGNNIVTTFHDVIVTGPESANSVFVNTGTLAILPGGSLAVGDISISSLLRVDAGGALTSSGPITGQAGGTLALGAGTAVSSNLTLGSGGGASFTLRVAGAASSATYSGVIGQAFAGAALIKTGTGALTLTRANTYSGGTTLSEGTLRIGNNNALGTGPLTVEAGTTLATNGSARTLANNIVVNGDFSIFPAGTLVGINAFSLNGAIDLTGGVRTITNPSDFSAGQFGQVSFGGVISNGGLRLVGLPGSAAAFFRMNGAQSNTYTGDTLIGESVSLQLAKTGGAIAIGGNLEILNDGVAAVNLSEQIVDTASVTIRGIGRLQLGAGAAVTETIGSLFGDGEVTLDDTGAGSTLRVGAGVFSGVINEGVAGGVSLEKIGADTLVLSGNNTYLGDTVITSGTLQVGAGGTSGALGSGNVVNHGALIFDRGDAATVANAISGTGDVTKRGAGVLTFTGANTYLGTTTIDAGTLRIGDGGTSGSLGAGNVINHGALVFDRGDDFTVAGLISGTGSVTQQGLGTTTLASANTYGGGTTITAGTLRLGVSGALGTGGLVINGGVLDLNDLEQTVTSLSGTGGSIDFSSSPYSSRLVVDQDTDTTYSGDFVRMIHFEKHGSGSLTLNGTLTSNWGYFIIGEGTLVLNGANNMTSGWGTHEIYLRDAVLEVGNDLALGASPLYVKSANSRLQSNRSVTLNNNILLDRDLGANLTIGGAFPLTLNGAISETGAVPTGGQIIKNGSSTLTLSGANTYTGGTRLDSGTLRVGHDSALGTGALSIADGTTLGNDGAARTLANDLVVNGDFSLSATAPTAPTAGAAALAFTGAVDLGGGARTVTHRFDSGSGQAGLMDFGGVIANGGLTLAASPGAQAFFRMSGSQSNTYTGDTVVGSGVSLELARNAQTSIAGDLFINDGAVVKTAWSRQIAETSSVTINGAGRLEIGATEGRFESIDALFGDGEVRLFSDVSSGGGLDVRSGVFSGKITGGAPDEFAVVKEGAGLLVLSGTNTFAGKTLVNGGTLQLGDGGTTGSLAGDIELRNGSSLVFDRSDAFTVANLVGGSGTLTKNGAGTLTLTAANTYSGATTINAGVLRVGAGGTSGSLGAGQVTNNAALVFDRSDTITVANVITSGGTVAQQGSGTLVLTGANTFSGGTTITAGRIQFSGTDNFGTGSVTLDGGGLRWATGTTTDISGRLAALGSGGAVFDTNGNDVVFATALSGAGQLTKDGAGSLTLASGNTYAGGTLVLGGELVVSLDALPGDAEVGSGAFLTFDQNPDGTFTGLVSGAGGVRYNGEGTITLAAVQTYTGETQINAGGLLATAAILADRDLVMSSGAGLILNQTEAGTYAGELSGAGGFVKLGAGTLDLTGVNTYTGPTLVNAGGLLVNGSLGDSVVTVGSGAFLGGSGSIAGDVVIQSGGFLRPGNSPGILTVGSLVLNAGSFTQMEINGAGAAGTDYDQIRVTGEATLGGTLELIFGGGFVPGAGDSFTLIDAGSITAGSDFDVVNGLGNALAFSISITDDYIISVTAEQSDFLGFARTRNQRAVARNLDSDWTNPALAPVLTHLNALPGTSLPAAFDLIAPDEFAAMPRVAQSNTRAMWSDLRRRLAEIRAGSTGWSVGNLNLGSGGKLDLANGVMLAAVGDTADAVGLRALAAKSESAAPAADERRGFFVSGTGTVGDNEADGNADGYDFSAGGILIGADSRLTPDSTVGLMAGYGHTETESAASASDIADETARLGAYGTWSGVNDTWLNATASGAYHWYDTERESLGGKAVGDTGATELNALLEAGRDNAFGRWTITPTAAVDYLWLWVEGFEESGSLAPLTVDDESSESLRGELALTATYRIEGKSVTWSPYVRAGVQHEFLDTSSAVQARLSSGAGGLFSVDGTEVAPDSAVFAAGVQARIGAATEAGLSYSGEINDDYQTHSVNAHLRVRF